MIPSQVRQGQSNGEMTDRSVLNGKVKELSFLRSESPSRKENIGQGIESLNG